MNSIALKPAPAKRHEAGISDLPDTLFEGIANPTKAKVSDTIDVVSVVLERSAG